MDHKMSRSPWVIHYDGSSCNGCDIEVLASLTPLFDAERFGVVNTGNPKHADIFLVTGSVNAQNLPVVRQIYNQMLEPKCVVACGICACSGGVFRDAYNVIGGVDRAIPVDVYAPGCAIRPETVIVAGSGHGNAEQILVIVNRLDHRAQEEQELRVFIRRIARFEEVCAGIRRYRPVVVLAAAVYAGKRFFVEQAHHMVLFSHFLHNFHCQLVVIRRNVCGGEYRC